MTNHIKYLWSVEHYRAPLINLILKSGGRYILTCKEISEILSSDKSDDQIYKIFRSFASNHINARAESDYIKSRQKKANIRYNELSKIDGLDMPYQRYLDFGSGDCSMAVLLGKRFNISDGNIYAVDIQDWGGSLLDPGIYKSQCKFRIFDGTNIPFKDDSFDLITAFQVLHHIEQLESILVEINRVLCKGGIFIIREHNCHNSKMAKLIEIEHELHNKVFNPIINEKEAYSNYRKKKELKQYILDAGFEYIGENCMKEPSDLIWNPTRYYYQAFSKV